MRLIVSLLPAFLILASCDRQAVQLEFDIPDSYSRILKIRSHPPEGLALRLTNEVIEIHFTTKGILHRGFHPNEFPGEIDSPYRYAREQKLPTATLDDYLAAMEHWLRAGKAAGGVCLKSTVAYERTLLFEMVDKERAAGIFGRPESQLSEAEVKHFEDFIMWRLAELSARLELPFQIHTGHARIQGSNPMNLLNLIKANPQTKFILFHEGYPWIGETGAIM